MHTLYVSSIVCDKEFNFQIYFIKITNNENKEFICNRNTQLRLSTFQM